MRAALSHCSGSIIFPFLLLSLQPGLGSQTRFYNNKILPLADCAPEPAKQMVFEPCCQKYIIFLMNFNNSYLKSISSILHRSARSTIPVVARTCRFCGAQIDTIFWMNFNNSSCCCYVILNSLALNNGFGHIFVLLEFLHDHETSLPSFNFIMIMFFSMFS